LSRQTKPEAQAVWRTLRANVAAVGDVEIELAVVLGRKIVLIAAVVRILIAVDRAADVVERNRPLALGEDLAVAEIEVGVVGCSIDDH
jgi:hypothetical protein